MSSSDKADTDTLGNSDSGTDSESEPEPVGNSESDPVESSEKVESSDKDPVEMSESDSVENSESVSKVASDGTEHPLEAAIDASIADVSMETSGEQTTDTEPTTDVAEQTGAAEVTGKPVSNEAGKPYPWIISPVVDLLFVAGGMVWILLLANYLLIGTELPFNRSEPKQLVLLSVIYVSQHVFFDAHNIATYFRLWGSNEDREAFKFYRTWLFYAAIALFVLGVAVHSIIGTLVFWYLAVTFWHYAMQTFGVALIYCAKRNYELSGFEREVFRTLMLLLSAYAIARFLVTQQLAPYNIYGAAAPFWMPLNTRSAHLILQVITSAVATVSVVFAFVVVRKLIVMRRMLPFPVLMMLATMGALACAPRNINALLWLYVPALYHASQYMAVSLSYYIKERGLPEGMDTRLIAQEVRKWPALNYFGKAVLIGCTLYIVLPHLVQLVSLGGYDETIGLTFVVVNYHHFATDAAIWRLRDARVRKILIA